MGVDAQTNFGCFPKIEFDGSNRTSRLWRTEIYEEMSPERDLLSSEISMTFLETRSHVIP